MANLGISGIASGVDTASIVTQLLSIDKQGQTRTKLDQSRLTAKDTGLKDLQSKLGALRAAAVALRAPAVWADRQTVESSHPTQVAVERTSGAGTGATSIRVTGLASSSQRTFTWTPDASAERTLDITSGSTSTPVTVGAGATLDDVVAAINSSTTSPVYAAAVRTDPSDPASARLVLSSRETGAGSSFTLNEGGAAVADVAGTARAGKDATYFVDGETDPALVRTSASNVVTNAIPGLQLTLKGVTAGEVSITVGSPLPDLEGAKGKVKALVEAYNAVLTLARTKTTEKVVTDPTTTADAVKGQLFGDRGLVGMVNTLRSGVSGNVSGNAPAHGRARGPRHLHGRHRRRALRDGHAGHRRREAHRDAHEGPARRPAAARRDPRRRRHRPAHGGPRGRAGRADGRPGRHGRPGPAHQGPAGRAAPPRRRPHALRRADRLP